MRTRLAIPPIGLLATAIAACLPSYTLVEGSGGAGGHSATSSSAGGATSTSTSTSAGGGSGGGPCADSSCDPKHCGSKDTDCLGALCVAGQCQPITVVEKTRGANGIAVDAKSVYWTDLERLTVSACPVEGCGGGLVMDFALGTNPWRVAITETHIYWTDNGGAETVRRCDLPDCAGGVETIFQGPPYANGLAVDDSYVYFGLGDGGVNGKVMRCPLAGCGPGNADAFTYFTEPWSVSTVVVTGTDIFWIDATNTIQKCKFSGCPTPPLVPLVLATSAADALAVEGDHFFWGATKSGGGIFRCFLTGCGPGDVNAVMIAPTITRPSDITFDGGHIYWIEQGSQGVPPDGLVMRAEKDGANLTTLAAGRRFPVAMALDASSVWWLERGVGSDPGANDGSIGRVAK